MGGSLWSGCDKAAGSSRPEVGNAHCRGPQRLEQAGPRHGGMPACVVAPLYVMVGRSTPVLAAPRHELASRLMVGRVAPSEMLKNSSSTAQRLGRPRSGSQRGLGTFTARGTSGLVSGSKAAGWRTMGSRHLPLSMVQTFQAPQEETSACGHSRFLSSENATTCRVAPRRSRGAGAPAVYPLKGTPGPLAASRAWLASYRHVVRLARRLQATALLISCRAETPRLQVLLPALQVASHCL